MTIEIHDPEIEALIEHNVESGAFRDAGDVVVQAIRAFPVAQHASITSGLTGADIVAAFQKCPYPDFMPEPERIYMPVSDPVRF